MKRFRLFLIVILIFILGCAMTAILWSASIRTYDAQTARLIQQADPALYREDQGLIMTGDIQEKAFLFFPDDRIEPGSYIPLAWQLQPAAPSLINPLVFCSSALNRNFTDLILERYPDTDFILIAHGQGSRQAAAMAAAAPDQIAGLILLDAQENLSVAEVPTLILRSDPACQSEVETVCLSQPADQTLLALQNSEAGADTQAEARHKTAEIIFEWMRLHQLTE